MFGKMVRVIKHGMLYGMKGRYVQICMTCGCVYACRLKGVKCRESSLSHKRYLDTTCPECGALNVEDVTEALSQAQERPAD